MNFKAKTSLTLSAAALLFLSACGDDSSSKPVDTVIEELPVTDSTQVNDNPTPGDSINTPADTASTTPADSIPAVDDSTSTEPTSKIVMPDARRSNRHHPCNHYSQRRRQGPLDR